MGGMDLWNSMVAKRTGWNGRYGSKVKVEMQEGIISYGRVGLK